MTQAFGKVTYDRAAGCRRTAASLTTPTRSDGHVVGVRRHRTAIRQQLAGRQRRATSARLQPGSDERQRQRRLSPDQHGASSAFAAGCSRRQLQGHRRVDRHARRLESAVASACPACRPTLQLPNGRRTRRACRSPNKDETKTGFFQLDYNQSFNAGGVAPAQGRLRRAAHAPTTWTRLYPGGYVLLDWGPSFAQQRHGIRPAPAPTATTRSTTAARAARSTRTCRRSTCRTRGRSAAALTLNLGVRTEKENDSLVPHRHQGNRVRVRLRQEDRAAPRRDLRRARRRPPEGVRQLGPLLRLGQVRAGARIVRRRHLA